MSYFNKNEFDNLKRGISKPYFGNKDEIIRKLCEDLEDTIAIVEAHEDLNLGEEIDGLTDSIGEIIDNLRKVEDTLERVKDKIDRTI